MDIDEAVKHRGATGKSEEEILKEVDKIQSQDEKFNEIYSLVFGLKEQPHKEGEKVKYKVMSSLPDGRVVFVDRSQNEEDIALEEPYICLVYKRAKEAFAKVLFPQYQPHIYIPPNRLPVMVWRDKKGKIQRKRPIGKSYEERIISAIKEMEHMGFEHVKVVYRRNIRD
jgi:hypothetical protein